MDLNPWLRIWSSNAIDLKFQRGDSYDVFAFLYICIFVYNLYLCVWRCVCVWRFATHKHSSSSGGCVCVVTPGPLYIPTNEPLTRVLPQGSVLVPVLFWSYDRPRHPSADDTKSLIAVKANQRDLHDIYCVSYWGLPTRLQWVDGRELLHT